MMRARIVKYTLILVLLLSVGLTVGSIWRHGRDSSGSSTNMAQQRSFQPGGGFGQNEDRSGRQGSMRPSGGEQGGGSPPSSAGGRAGGMRPPGSRNGFGGGSSNSSSAYAMPLAAYTVLFFGLAGAAYYGVKRQRIRLPESNRRLLVWTLLGAGLCLRIALAPWIPGHPFDLNLFKQWAASAARDLTGFYLHGSSDYPPFYIFILYAVGKLTSVSALSPYSTLLIKLPSILADIATAYLLYRAASKRVSFEIGFLIAAFYVLNPAVFINSTFWGQVDSFFTLIIVAFVVLLSENKHGWAAALLTAGVLMKPQAIVYLPVLFFALVNAKRVKIWLAAAASALATALLVVLPFSIGQDPLWLFKLYAGTVNEYPYASVNAYNFFAFLGANYKQDSSVLFLFSYHTWGMIFIVLITLFSWWTYARSRSPKFASAAALLQIAGVFTFSSSMHERYLFPAAALALLAFIYFQDKRLLWLSAGFSLTIFTNTYYVLYHSTNGGAPYNLTLSVTSLLNILLVAYLARVVWKIAKTGDTLQNAE